MRSVDEVEGVSGNTAIFQKIVQTRKSYKTYDGLIICIIFFSNLHRYPKISISLFSRELPDKHFFPSIASGHGKQKLCEEKFNILL